jgi:hypothetical protein
MKIKKFSIHKISDTSFNVIGEYDTPSVLPIILQHTRSEKKAEQYIKNLKKGLQK